MSATLFISDLHLDDSRPAVTAALEQFLLDNAGCEALYILGDLFEAWVGDDEDSPLSQRVRDCFRQFSASGAQLYLMVGNRDFLLGESFCRDTGAELLQDPTLIQLHDQATLLMHGDSLCTDDAPYLEWRQTCRDPAWQASFMAQALEERRMIAAQLRTASMDANSNKAEDIMDVAAAEVERVMAEHGAVTLIHGHTHRPNRHELADGRCRWVLGDWNQQAWIIRAEGAKKELISLYISDS